MNNNTNSGGSGLSDQSANGAFHTPSSQGRQVNCPPPAMANAHQQAFTQSPENILSGDDAASTSPGHGAD